MMAENTHSVGSKGEGGGEINVADWSPFNTLPEDCISNIVSFTSPRDACVFAAVSKTFESAVKSDIIWEKFLPPEYTSMIPPSLASSSKMVIYFSLCNNPVLIEDGKKCVWLEKTSGKRCIMLSGESLYIKWINDTHCWDWITSPGSRFEKVAKVNDVCWFEIRGTINTHELSPRTRYSSYIVFKEGFKDLPIEAGVGVVGKQVSTRFFCFDVGAVGQFLKRGRRKWYFEKPKEREDGWREIELGRFFNKGGLMNNSVWEKFLPLDYTSLAPASRVFSSKRELYFALCNHFLIENGKKSFWLEKASGNKCVMLAARALWITWGSSPEYWQWISMPESRFEEVAELRNVCAFEMGGSMNTQVLSPGTHYSAYFVYKIRNRRHGLRDLPIQVGVGFKGQEMPKKFICFDVSNDRVKQWPRKELMSSERREDGWIEAEIGDFFNEEGCDEIEVSIVDITSGNWKCGVIIEGIEFRPKGLSVN
ncbi:hypothetical protein N665_0012s0036 [Sinapis alba]|nr:hypothetical protein N665_0012s0036 [Sinapis alba]